MSDSSVERYFVWVRSILTLNYQNTTQLHSVNVVCADCEANIQILIKLLLSLDPGWWFHTKSICWKRVYCGRGFSVEVSNMLHTVVITRCNHVSWEPWILQNKCSSSLLVTLLIDSAYCTLEQRLASARRRIISLICLLSIPKSRAIQFPGKHNLHLYVVVRILFMSDIGLAGKFTGSSRRI